MNLVQICYHKFKFVCNIQPKFVFCSEFGSASYGRVITVEILGLSSNRKKTKKNGGPFVSRAKETNPPHCVLGNSREEKKKRSHLTPPTPSPTPTTTPTHSLPSPQSPIRRKVRDVFVSGEFRGGGRAMYVMSAGAGLSLLQTTNTFSPITWSRP